VNVRGLPVAAVMLVACSTAPAHDPATTTQLRSYQTYRLLPASSYGKVDDVAMGRTVVRSLDETLAAKGYRQEAGRPDFFVKWRVSIPNRPSLAPLQEPQATLVLDIVDTGSDTVVWRGSGQTELAGSGEAEAREARIEEAVRRILERFPPQ
jgi:uncharacterized protein DUF4136